MFTGDSLSLLYSSEAEGLSELSYLFSALRSSSVFLSSAADCSIVWYSAVCKDCLTSSTVALSLWFYVEIMLISFFKF